MQLIDVAESSGDQQLAFGEKPSGVAWRAFR